MHCNGHCHLKKQFDEQEKKEQRAPAGNLKEKNEIVYFLDKNQKAFFTLCENTQHYFYQEKNLLTGFSSSVFHPPSC